MNFIYLKEIIEEYNSIVIYRHIRPDYDAYGAQLGLKHLLLENYPNKNVFTYGLENMDNPEFLEDMDNPSLDIIKNSLTIILDTSTHDRADDQSYIYGLKSLKIDHHLESEGNADYMFIDESASSTSELVALLAIKNNWVINKKAASYLYAGMNTDTRGFTIKSVSSTTFKVLSILIEKGIDLVEINRYINDLSRQKFEAKHYLASTAIFKEDVAYIILSKEIKEKLGLSTHEAKDFVYVLDSIKGINKYAFFFYEDEREGFSVSLRSHKAPIVEIAKKFGGGGHKLACDIPEISAEQIDDVIDLLIKAKE
ncbi:MAG TPA: bifunctional oligoribonuclease/PAP phosphatase NrnA [Erysipelotrichaceae bacterium]|mgnify:FL=1|nr:bifunctional oligoribonuclease/PAP phosphatase NrnA [Erysipelotrichaceae bacterium]HQA85304.1 bifunctional oligoribonuclease/PAP phosphatase NrnA [Erysipelotrichaceae bacterium]